MTPVLLLASSGSSSPLGATNRRRQTILPALFRVADLLLDFAATEHLLDLTPTKRELNRHGPLTQVPPESHPERADC